MREHNFKTGLGKKIAKKIGRAVSDFSMIRKDDKILVGTSGGKDSNLLLYALCRLREISPVRFGIAAAVIDPTENQELATLEAFAESMSVALEIVRYPVFSILEASPDTSACSLCANIRRGILASTAVKLGCNVLALGHHRDDVVETVFMNLIYSGRFACFHPNAYMSRTRLRVIRPMVYVPEAEIKKESERLELPVVDFGCRYASLSSRSLIKSKVAELSQVAGDISGSVLHALQKNRDEGAWGCECAQRDPTVFKEIDDDFR